MEPPQIRTSFSCFSFLDAMYTFAPFATRPDAIIFPIPEPPPVTRAVYRVHMSGVYEVDAFAEFVQQHLATLSASNEVIHTDFALHREQARDFEVCGVKGRVIMAYIVQDLQHTTDRRAT